MKTNIVSDLPTRETVNMSYSEALVKFQKDLDWWKVLAFMDMPDFNPSYKSISTKTGCSVEKVAEIIEGLIVLGRVQRASDGFEVISTQLPIDANKTMPREEMISVYNRLAMQVISERKPEGIGFNRVLFQASNKELITEYFHKLTALSEEFRLKSEEATVKDAVYGICGVGTSVTLIGGH